MKKIVIVLFAAATIFSATAQIGKKKSKKKNAKAAIEQPVVLNSSVDSLAYAIGMSVANMFLQNIDQVPGGSMKIDSIQAGFNAGFEYELGYAIGMMYAGQVREQMSTQTDGALYDKAIILSAFSKKIKADSSLLLSNEAAAKIQKEYVSPKRLAEKKRILAEADSLLKVNKMREGVVETVSGLQYRVLTPGSGLKPSMESTVKVNYRGMLPDGTVFDEGKGVSFPVSGVIPGFTEALLLMNSGDKYEILIPWKLAYGERGAGDRIKPYTNLIFELELIEIQKEEVPDIK